PEGQDPAYPPHVFYALVRAVIENEPTIMSSAVAFQRGEFHLPVDPKTLDDVNVPKDEDTRRGFKEESTEHRQMFGAYAYRRDGKVATANLASLYNQSYDQPDEEGTKWFTTHLTYRLSGRRINTSLTAEGSVSPMVVLTQQQDGHWSTNPIFDCGASNTWLLAFSLPFFARAADG
ncbi:hypothetical protein OTU49_013291, partial [Cherax quadricarinatus]